MTKHNDKPGPTDWNCTMAWDRSRQLLHASAVLLAICAFSASASVSPRTWPKPRARSKPARTDRPRHARSMSTLKRIWSAPILTREDRELLDAKKREQVVPGSVAQPARGLL